MCASLNTFKRAVDCCPDCSSCAWPTPGRCCCRWCRRCCCPLRAAAAAAACRPARPGEPRSPTAKRWPIKTACSDCERSTASRWDSPWRRTAAVARLCCSTPDGRPLRKAAARRACPWAARRCLCCTWPRDLRWALRLESWVRCPASGSDRGAGVREPTSSWTRSGTSPSRSRLLRRSYRRRKRWPEPSVARERGRWRSPCTSRSKRRQQRNLRVKLSMKLFSWYNEKHFTDDCVHCWLKETDFVELVVSGYGEFRR